MERTELQPAGRRTRPKVHFRMLALQWGIDQMSEYLAVDGSPWQKPIYWGWAGRLLRGRFHEKRCYMCSVIMLRFHRNFKFQGVRKESWAQTQGARVLVIPARNLSWDPGQV